nr:four helix bundle protein [Chitinophagaceae bacterium]
MKEIIVKLKSYFFALEINKLYQFMKRESEWVFSKQVLRSGTSIGANVEAADAGVSKRDFASKMSLASKEARET